MRKIQIEEWKVESKEGDRTESLLVMINVLISGMKPENMPKGIDKARMYSRIGKAFDKAETTKVLELEEVDYAFIKGLFENSVPAIWGLNKKITKAMEDFLDAKLEN